MAVARVDGTKRSAVVWGTAHATAGDCAASYTVTDDSTQGGIFKAPGTSHQVLEEVGMKQTTTSCATADAGKGPTSTTAVQAIGSIATALGDFIGTAISTVLKAVGL